MMPAVPWEKAWLRWALGATLILFVVAPVLDPSEQLYYRDTLRCAYHFKHFIAEQLNAGRSPFWDPWTESGTSVLVQITPGLLHPLTLLYLLLPFELAFKLNHLLAIPLAWVGLYLLARKIGSSAWGAAAGACGYAACGYLSSVVASNLHYALGAGMMPLTLHAFLRFAERPRPMRLLWAAYALALCFYGGEPQTMLLSGVIGAVWLAGLSLLRREGVVRSLGQIAAWGVCALLLAAPAITPVVARLETSVRQSGVSDNERSLFANSPSRLLGLLLPWAFDNVQDLSAPRTSRYTEYFAGPEEGDAFIDSIVLGAPILLLAFASGKRGRFPLAGAALLALASAGSKLGILHALEIVIPGMKLFRYPEKLIAPASMLLCLAAALGASRLEESAWKLLKLSIACAVALTLAWAGLRLGHASLVSWLQAHGRTGDLALARGLAATLDQALAFEAGAAVLVAVIALWSTRRRVFPAAAALALLCAAAAVVQTWGLLYTTPLYILHSPLLLAEELKAVAGPSEARWRIRGDSALFPVLLVFDLRTSRMQAAAQMLEPQFNALGGIESISEYSSLGDFDYDAAIANAPSATNQILGVRFDVRSSYYLTAERASKLGYHAAAFGSWVKQFPERPRAFLAGCARSIPDLQGAVQSLVSRFRIGEAVVRKEVALPCPAQGEGDVELTRSAADRMLAQTNSSKASLLVVSEHYDKGWRATVDGKPAEVIQADLTALGVVVPQGKHQVSLRFVPDLLWLGLLLCGGCVLALSTLELLQRDHRVGAAEAK
jgi:hypothetical protein